MKGNAQTYTISNRHESSIAHRGCHWPSAPFMSTVRLSFQWLYPEAHTYGAGSEVEEIGRGDVQFEVRKSATLFSNAQEKASMLVVMRVCDWNITRNFHHASYWSIDLGILIPALLRTSTSSRWGAFGTCILLAWQNSMGLFTRLSAKLPSNVLWS